MRAEPAQPSVYTGPDLLQPFGTLLLPKLATVLLGWQRILPTVLL